MKKIREFIGVMTMITLITVMIFGLMLMRGSALQNIVACTLFFGPIILMKKIFNDIKGKRD